MGQFMRDMRKSTIANRVQREQNDKNFEWILDAYENNTAKLSHRKMIYEKN